jgi:ParB-like chromosome segregation protein Spo0J
MKKARNGSTEHVNPRKLNPSVYNPRKISPRELANLRKSIRAFGFVQPIVARRADRAIIGGHQRHKAALLERLASVPVIFLDIDEKRAKALNLALNRIHGEWDAPKLKAVLEELGDGELLGLTGFDPKEIRELSEETTDAIEEIDTRPFPKMVWILLGVSVDRFGEVREQLAALQEVADLDVQCNRDT